MTSLKFCLAMLAASFSLCGQGGFPKSGEGLTYTVNWPSGLSLGEARITATPVKQSAGEPRWNFELHLDAALPGFAVKDRFRSMVSAELCSLEFEQDVARGRRKTQEKIAFDPPARQARRVTVGGGSSTVSTPECAKDALAFLFHARRELAQGRVPPSQTIFLGGPYTIRMEFSGTQAVQVNDKPVEADRVVATVKGPASEWRIELFFARDAARTPVVIRAPFAMGTFSMELAP
jgi:Protein of unknown function (DUF3108)